MSHEILALNASYEPLRLLPFPRAVRLVLEGKAEIVEADEAAPVRSGSQEIARPAVIRLRKFVHVPRRFRKQVTNTILFNRDGRACGYCGRHERMLGPREMLTRDHVQPLSRGGSDTYLNTVTACSTCNHRKGSKLLSELGWTLRVQPCEPEMIYLQWTVRKLTALQVKWLKTWYGDEVVAALKKMDLARYRNIA